MKRTLFFIFFVVICFCSCDHDEQMAKDRQAVLVYFVGNNSLSDDGVRDYATIKKNWLPTTRGSDKVLLVYHHFKNETPVLVRLSRDRRGNVAEDIIRVYPEGTNSADAQTLATVLEDAEVAWPTVHHGIILWSHGSGFLPPGYYSHPQERGRDALQEQEDPYAFMVKADDDTVKSFGEDNKEEMDMLDLTRVLSRFHYDFIAFDCCLMANVELAYEMRNICDYLLFSPTEILTDGFPYEMVTQVLFTQTAEAAMRSVAEGYMAHYRALSGVYRSATISIVDTYRLQALAAACRTVFENHREEILFLDRNGVQRYFRNDKHWYYDIDDFVQQVATDEEYLAFNRALNQAVIFRDATEYFLDIPITHYSGLSSYIPRTEYTVLNNYYKKLAWNQATGLIP